jgi:hypothetical protein
MYLMGAIYILSEERTFDNIISFIGNLFYVTGYVAYIKECREDNGVLLSEQKAIPFFTRPIMREPLLPL